MAVSPVFLASLVTVLPAMAILWLVLRRYEGYFQESHLFWTLIVGLFAGLATAAFEFYTDFGSPTLVAEIGVAPAFLFFVVGYAFFDSGVKSVILGLRRFRGRKDAPYYGTSLGLAIGAMVAMMIVASALRAGETAGTPYGWGSGIVMALIPAGGMMVHGACGAWIGLGSSQGKLWKGWGIATLMQAGSWLLYWLWWPSIGRGDLPGWNGIGTSILSLVFGLGMLWLAQSMVLDRVVPKDIQDQVRRANRRKKRSARRQ